jgi:hypothetical protein
MEILKIGAPKINLSSVYKGKNPIIAYCGYKPETLHVGSSYRVDTHSDGICYTLKRGLPSHVILIENTFSSDW